MKHRFMRALGGVTTLAMLALAGTLLMGAGQGSQTDPLVTVSYLTDVALPKAMKDAQAKLDIREKSLKAQLAQSAEAYGKQLEKKTGSAAEKAAVFAAVTVPAGKKLTGGVGTEFLLTSGTAICVASAVPGLVDSTDGSILPSGGSLLQNHLYLATADGRGLSASGDVVVMVRGSHTVA